MARTDAERVAKWQTIRDDAENRLAEIVSNRKPSYNIDGQQVSWNEYHGVLTKTIKDATEIIDRLEGPYEITSSALT